MDKLVEVKNEEVSVQVIMDKSQAEMLTEDIKSTSTALYILLKQAHDEGAYIALGYKSWTEYVEKEFEFSRTRSYQLINQAKVIEEINEASGVQMYITEREARAIKSRLPGITEKLKEQVKEAEMSDEEKEAIAREILLDEDEANRENFVDKAEEHEESVNTAPVSEVEEEEVDAYISKGIAAKEALHEEDKFYYDNLLITLQIFKEFPDASVFGKLIDNSTENKKELKQLAEGAFSWIAKLLDEVQ